MFVVVEFVVVGLLHLYLSGNLFQFFGKLN